MQKSKIKIDYTKYITVGLLFFIIFLSLAKADLIVNPYPQSGQLGISSPVTSIVNGTSTSQINLAYNITHFVPLCNPSAGIGFSFCQFGQTIGSEINQIQFTLNIESYPSYLSNQQASVLESERELYMEHLELKNGTITPAQFNTTSIAISSQVNTSLVEVNKTALQSSTIFTNTSNTNLTSTFLVNTNASFNSESYQIVQADSQIPSVVNSGTPISIPAVTDPPPGSIATLPSGSTWSGGYTYTLPVGGTFTVPQYYTSASKYPNYIGNQNPSASPNPSSSIKYHVSIPTPTIPVQFFPPPPPPTKGSYISPIPLYHPAPSGSAVSIFPSIKSIFRWH